MEKKGRKGTSVKGALWKTFASVAGVYLRFINIIQNYYMYLLKFSKKL